MDEFDELWGGLPIDDTLIDNLLLDTCHNLGCDLVEDLEDVFDYYFPTYPYPQQKATIETAMDMLLEWRKGPDPDYHLDDASCSKASTEMFLYKLWQANFMADACGYDAGIWEEIFDLRLYRKSILLKSTELADPDQFCIDTLVALYDAYTEWESYPVNMREWRKHCGLFRATGAPLPVIFETEGDNKVLLTNNPLYDTDWIDQIRQETSTTWNIVQVGDGQSAPILAKLDPINGITIYYSKAAAPCADMTRQDEDDDVVGNGKVFDVSCHTTSNWINHFFAQFQVDPEP